MSPSTSCGRAAPLARLVPGSYIGRGVALIDEAEAAASRSANEAAEQARARALDPALSVREVAEARRQMEDGAFARELSAAVPRLQQRRKELVEAEEDARRRGDPLDPGRGPPQVLGRVLDAVGSNRTIDL